MKKAVKQEKQKIPVFKTRKEEAEFWDTHSPLDFPDYWEDVDAEIKKPLRHEVVLSVRLDADISKKMEVLAGRRHIGKSTLARMLIIEGLENMEKAK
ncbi:MAG: CopG family antitoxin [Thermoleophilia bacterium]|nr:CopG family antitoxin [Thermoleophilia bacterium]